MKKFSFSFFIPFLLTAFCTSICFAEFGNNNLPNEPEPNSPKTREELIEGIRKRLQSVQGKMKRFEKKEPAITKNKLPEKNLASSNFNYESAKPESSSDLSAAENNPEGNNAPYWSENSTGMYFLPFFGLSFSSDLEWTRSNSNINIPITIEQKNGFLGGYKLGYNWESLYLEHKMFYFKNNFENTSPFVTDGQFSGFSTLVSGGLNFSFSDYVKWKVGAGVGATNQELDIVILDRSESGVGLTYEFSTGVELRPFEHFLLGFHYNWYFTPEFSAFSGRHLNSLELSLGYFH